MKAEEMEARLKALEKKVGLLDDINEVKRLQRIYSYYVQHMMRDEIYNLFADHPDVRLHWLEGTWLGKEGVKRYFGVGSDRPEPPPGFLHQVMPIAGVVDVDPPPGNAYRRRRRRRPRRPESQGTLVLVRGRRRTAPRRRRIQLLYRRRPL